MKGDNSLQGDSIFQMLMNSSTGPGKSLFDLASTGDPSNASEGYAGRRENMLRDLFDSTEGLRESFGSAGVGQGGDVLRAAALERSRGLSTFASSEMDRELAAREAAAGRRGQGLALLGQVGQGMDSRSLGKFGQYAPLLMQFLQAASGSRASGGGGFSAAYSGSYSKDSDGGKSYSWGG
jgi:hypothetical protein